MQARQELTNSSKLISNSNTFVLEKYLQLNIENKKHVLLFSDLQNKSTFERFFTEANDDIISALNSNEQVMEALVGHKLEYQRSDYEFIAEVLDDVEGVTSESKKFMESWLERSAGLSTFKGAAKLGNELNENIINSIVSGGKVRNLLQNKLRVNLEEYFLLKEIPFEVPTTSNTPGGFMKADIVLIKYDELTLEIEDIIIIENKLRGTTSFTPAQTLKFKQVKEANDGGTINFRIKFNKPEYNLISNQEIEVPKENILKIKDSGSSNADNLSLEDIILVKDLDF